MRNPLLWASLVLLLVFAGSVPGGAQDSSDEIEELREEQEQVQADREEQEVEIDTATAEANELAEALEVLNTQVNEQTTEVEAARLRLDAANTRHDEAVAAVDEINGEIDDLEERLEERAISAFVRRDSATTPILGEADPNKAVRMQSLVETVSGDELSLVDELQGLSEDLEIEQAAADTAAEEAEEIATQLEDDLAGLEAKQEEQADLAAQAEEQLEAALAEAAALEQLDADIAAEITEKNDELATQAALAQRNSDESSSSGSTGGGSTSGGTADFPSQGDIVQVQGIWVHRDIASELDAMLTAASAQGHNFTGGGYRDPQDQIRLRRAHCGTSNYAIYQMPSSQCTPPTATPGKSNHERGKAIDFKYNGSLITSRSNAGFQWLSANAAAYGFFNLPSEPWHWSVDGR